MNKAILQMKLDELADWMVSQGVQQADADDISHYARNRAVVSEAQVRIDKQFLMDFDRFGSNELGRMRQKSGAAMRKQRERILKTQPQVAVMVAR